MQLELKLLAMSSGYVCYFKIREKLHIFNLDCEAEAVFVPLKGVRI